jgi:hypothetical protein
MNHEERPGEGEESHEDSSVKGEGNGGGTAGAAGQKLTKEQLIDYVKKQRVKIKQLENKIQELESEGKGNQGPSSPGSPSASQGTTLRMISPHPSRIAQGLSTTRRFKN